MKCYTYGFNGQKDKARVQLSRGFTLIEMLVSVGLFTIVMTISVSTLLALVSANQKAQSLKSVINNLNFGLESMSRTIRTGYRYYCTDNISSTLPDVPFVAVQDCVNGATGIVLTDDRGIRLAYRYNSVSKNIERSIGNGSTWIPLTAPEVVVDGMLFYVIGTLSADLPQPIQPVVTISIRGHSGIKDATDSSFNIETSVTQRVLDQ